MLSLFSRRSSSKSSTSSSDSIKDRVFALNHSRAVPKPLATLKKKVGKLFKRDKVLASGIQFEVVLSQYAVKERQAIEAVSPKYLGTLDYDFLQAMKVMFEALHDPSVLDARRHKRLGLDQRPSINQPIEIDLSSLPPHTLARSPQIAASAVQMASPVLDLAVELAPLPTFEAPLNLLCNELNYFLAMSNPLPPDAPARQLSFEVHRFLGAGASGRVYQTRERVTNTKWALKIVPKDGREEAYILDYVDERLIHEKLQDSPWFTSLWASWHDQSNLYFAMTMYPTALDSEIQRVNGLGAKRARFYMSELVIGLSELHKRGILHGDLKPANILVDREGHLVISDFGLSIDFEGQPTIAQRIYQPFWPYLPEDHTDPYLPPRHPSELDFVTRGRRGSPYEMAPELYLSQWYSFGVDWWSAAVVLYWMLTGRPPFYEYTENGEKSKPLGRLIAEDPVRWAPHDDVDEVTKSFLNRMMDKDPKRRLLPELEIPTHPYFEGVSWKLMEQRQVPPPWIPTEEVSQDSKSYPNMPAPGECFSNESDPYPEFNFVCVEAQRAVHDGFQNTGQNIPTPEPLPRLELVPCPPDIETEPFEAEDQAIDEDKFEDITSVLSDPTSPSSPPSDGQSLGLEPSFSPSPDQTPGDASTEQTSNDDNSPVGLWSKLKFILQKIKLPKFRGWRPRLP